MARFSGSLRSTAGSTLLPTASLYAVAAAGITLREVHVFNTTATAVAFKLSRLDTAGTKPAAITDNEYWQDGPIALGTFHNTHTVGPTIDEEIDRFLLGAAIGSGVIKTYGDSGLVIPSGTANGIGLVLAVGTIQVVDVTFVWDE